MAYLLLIFDEIDCQLAPNLGDKCPLGSQCPNAKSRLPDANVRVEATDKTGAYIVCNTPKAISPLSVAGHLSALCSA